MGKRGPKPKPSAVKKLEGTFRPDRAPKNEAKPEAAKSIAPPASINEDEIAVKMWNEYAPKLQRNGLFTELDSPALEGLCVAYSRALRADAEIRKRGLIMQTEYGLRRNPAEPISTRAWAEVKRFFALFGMSPSDRTRVEAEPAGAAAGAEDAADESPDEKFLFSGAKERKVAGHIGPKR